MHGRNVHEQRLHRRIVGDAAPATRIGLHAIDENVQLAVESRRKIVHLIRFTILVLLSEECKQIDDYVAGLAFHET